MGLFSKSKVDGGPGVEVPNDEITSSETSTRPGGFERTHEPADVPTSRSSTAGQGVLKAMRLVQLLLAILILGLVAYAIDVFSATFVSERPDRNAYGLLN